MHPVHAAIHRKPDAGWRASAPRHLPHVEVVVVDEADRLKTTGLDHVRDIYDQHGSVSS